MVRARELDGRGALVVLFMVTEETKGRRSGQPINETAALLSRHRGLHFSP